jgi:hypothetical protein
MSVTTASASYTASYASAMLLSWYLSTRGTTMPPEVLGALTVIMGTVFHFSSVFFTALYNKYLPQATK